MTALTEGMPCEAYGPSHPGTWRPGVVSMIGHHCVFVTLDADGREVMLYRANVRPVRGAAPDREGGTDA